MRTHGTPSGRTPDSADEWPLSPEASAVVDALFASTTIGVALFDRDLRYVRVNDMLATINARSPADHLGRTSAQLIPQRTVTEYQRRALETGEPVTNVVVTDPGDDPRQPLGRSFRASYYPVRGIDEHGEPAVVGILATVVEATAQAEAEETIRNQVRLFHQIVGNVDSVLWVANDANETIYVSPAYSRVWGLDGEALVRGEDSFRNYVHPHDKERTVDTFDRLTEGYVVEYRIVLPDGRTRWVREQALPVHGSAGTVAVVAGIATDITEQRELESRLLQAQRLESLGRLAGGIAHDFNNYLTAMNGFGQLALMRAARGEVPTSELREVLAAGQRAAQLTSQLLAFGRARPHHVERLSFNGIIGQLDTLIRRVLDEDVTLALDLAPDVGLVHADPGQLEQVVMNLVVNARDAMPGGGSLTVRTRPAEAGGHELVELTVEDSGGGMDEETAARAFEPFFSTKETGAGTGLGLAVVYGIVRSLDGEISIESVVGSGTKVAVRLPAVAPLDEAEETEPVEDALDSTGSETVLVVEDEDAVRALVHQALEAGGYRVLEARSGEEAVQLVTVESGPIDLLLTDVVLGNMSGPELAELVAERRPGVKVLYTSGYSSQGRAARHLQPSEQVLDKPFTPDELTRRVRAVLDEL